MASLTESGRGHPRRCVQLAEEALAAGDEPFGPVLAAGACPGDGTHVRTHCPMCSAAHGWVGLRRLVYVHSSPRLACWLTDMGLAEPLVRMLPVHQVVPGVPVLGPIP